nr:retrotransposon Orf1 [Tanacetum cinerariifolium]
MGDENPIRTLGDYSKPSHEGYSNTIELPVENNMVPLRCDTIRLVKNGCSFYGLRSEDPNHHLKDFLKLVDSLTLTNDPRDFTKPVKAIALPQDVLSTSDRRLIKLENQVQRLMEAHLALTQPTQVNKIPTSCEICSGPHDTQYCMEHPEQAFVEYASSHTDEAGGKRRKLDSMENANGGVSNFTGRIKGMHVFVGNFTYVVDFMIIKDISSIIHPRLSQVVLGKPFVEISNMTHDPPEGVLRFTNRNNEVAYKMLHKIEQYYSLSNLEKEHTKSVYLRNEEDTRRGVEYVMSKILRFYKECQELKPEYLSGMDDEGEVT